MERTRLVLTRKRGESLWIGDAKVKVDGQGRNVRLVIEAPNTTKVVRDELRVRSA